MKAILFAIYVTGMGAADRTTPLTVSQYDMPSMAECRDTAKLMVKRVKVRRMRAFCEQVPA